jgi:hypothetical protein
LEQQRELQNNINSSDLPTKSLKVAFSSKISTNKWDVSSSARIANLAA